MYRIRRAAELAGMSPELLRAWERRYGLVCPVRTESGYRMYTDEDVRLLRGAKRLVDGGQSIAEVSKRPRAEIAAVMNAPVPGSPAPVEPSGPASDMRPVIDEALAAVASFNQDRLETALFRVMGLGTLSPEQLCDRLLLPLLKAIGDEWEGGRMSVAAEHFGSEIVRSKILRLIDHERIRGNSTAIVCACPPGEEHEGALLAFAVFASRAGFRVIYLGANTPAQDIVNAAESTRASIVALSVTNDPEATAIHALATHLERWRTEAAGRHVLVGGRAAIGNRAALELAGLHVAENIEAGLLAVASGAGA